MKKTKWLKSLGAATALAIPTATVMTTLASCSRKTYTELVSEMKDDCISKLITLCRTVHRNVWNEGEAVEYIKKEMAGLGYTEPSGYDTWSTLNAVKNFRDSEIKTLKDVYKEPGTDKEYGNMWYDIPATAGFENIPGVIIHTHIDSSMFFAGDEKTEIENHIKWSKNGVDVFFDRDNDLLSSESGTMSLGGDGGLGIATLLTIAKYQHRFNHGPLKLLFAVGESEPIAPFTKDGIKYPEYSAGFDLLKYDQLDDGTDKTIPEHEKRGLTYTHVGNRPFGDNWEYKYIISATGIKKDSICISSSGVHECQVDAGNKSEILKLNNKPATGQSIDNWTGNLIDWSETTKLPWYGEEDVPKNLMKLSIKGLQGGTTSTYIDNGQGSALILLANLLFCGDTSLQLIKTHSEPLSGYSISREASATFATFYDLPTWQAKIEMQKPIFKTRYPNEDWDHIEIKIEQIPHEQTDAPYHGISKLASRDLLSMIANQLYFGPITWFKSGEVETSENIGPFEININDSKNNATASLDFRVILRSSDTLGLTLFKHITHSIFQDGLMNLFGVSTPGDWSEIEEKHIFHIEDPAWEPATAENPNKLQAAFEKAFKNFNINYKLNNEHGWIEISCATKIFEEKKTTPHMVLIGGQIDNNHSPQESLQTDSITTLIETIVYVLDNCKTTLPKI